MSIHEAWAQALVANVMDIAKAWDVVYPDGPNSRIKSAKRKVALFNETIAVNPALWIRVAELQRKVDEHIALTAADVIRQYEIIATADRRGMVSIRNVKRPCVACGGSGKTGDAGCQYCNGTGATEDQAVVLADTDDYTPEQALVYEGAEQTKYGIKLHLASRKDAREALARHHGLFNDKLLLAKSGELPELPPLPDDPVEAARMYSEWVKS